MSLQKGNSACTTGLSKRIYDNRIAEAATIGLNTSSTNALKADCYALACAIVDEIQDNAVVSVSVGALQTSTSVGSPTGPPAIPVDLGVD